MSSSARPRPMGRFFWNITTGQWSWDAGMFELHGYRSGAVEVSTDLVLEHKLEEHRPFAREVLDTATSGNHRFSNYHSIVDTDGRRRTVLSIGESRVDPSRPTRSAHCARGFMVDVTEDEGVSTRRAVEMARRGSAPIQQSMGLLMGSFGLNEEAAFALVARVASHHNVKLRDLARRFMVAAADHAADPVAGRDLTQVLTLQAQAMAQERLRRVDA